MEYDYYKLYLGIDCVYREEDKKVCQSLEQVDYELNNATGYDAYLLVGRNKELNEDDILAQGYIQVNRLQKRKTK